MISEDRWTDNRQDIFVLYGFGSRPHDRRPSQVSLLGLEYRILRCQRGCFEIIVWLKVGPGCYTVKLSTGKYKIYGKENDYEIQN